MNFFSCSSLLLQLPNRGRKLWSPICAPVPPFSPLPFLSPHLINSPSSEMNSSSSSTSTSDGRTTHINYHEPRWTELLLCCAAVSSVHQVLLPQDQTTRVWDTKQESQKSLKRFKKKIINQEFRYMNIKNQLSNSLLFGYSTENGATVLCSFTSF